MKIGLELSDTAKDSLSRVFLVDIGSPDTIAKLEKALKDDAASLRYEIISGEIHLHKVKLKFACDYLWMTPYEFFIRKRIVREGQRGIVSGMYTFSKKDLSVTKVKRCMVALFNGLSIGVLVIYSPVILQMLVVSWQR